MRRTRPAIILCLLACAACTRIKDLTATTASPAPDASVAVAGFTPSPSGSASPSAAPGPVDSIAPVVLPTPRVNTGPQPQASFTPAVITPLGGFKTPTPCPSGTTCAATPSPTGTFAPGVTPPPSPTVSTLPGSSPSPLASATPKPFDVLAGMTLADTAGGAIDLVNNLWLGNTARKVVSAFTPGANIQGTFDVKKPPGALAFDKDGNAWIQAADLSQVVELDRFGNYVDTYTLTITADAVLGKPGLAPVPTGGMWVANGGGANTVVRLDEKGKVVTTIEAENGIAAIAGDAGGNVWIVGSAAGAKLTKYSPNGTWMGTFDDNLGLEDPKAAKVDKSGNLWVIGRHTVPPQPTQGLVVKFTGLGGRAAFIETGVDRFPVAFDFLPAPDSLVVANGVNGISAEHAGFQKVTQGGSVTAEKLYNAPTDVLVDRNGDVWGINGAREAFRFKL